MCRVRKRCWYWLWSSKRAAEPTKIKSVHYTWKWTSTQAWNKWLAKVSWKLLNRKRMWISQNKVDSCFEATEKGVPLFKFLINLFYFSVCVLSIHVFAHHMHAWCPKKPEQSIRSLWTKFTDGYDHHAHAGNQTWFLCKSNKCSKTLSHLSNIKNPL